MSDGLREAAESAMRVMGKCPWCGDSDEALHLNHALEHGRVTQWLASRPETLSELLAWLGAEPNKRRSVWWDTDSDGCVYVSDGEGMLRLSVPCAEPCGEVTVDASRMRRLMDTMITTGRLPQAESVHPQRLHSWIEQGGFRGVGASVFDSGLLMRWVGHALCMCPEDVIVMGHAKSAMQPAAFVANHWVALVMPVRYDSVEEANARVSLLSPQRAA